MLATISRFCFLCMPVLAIASPVTVQVVNVENQAVANVTVYLDALDSTVPKLPASGVEIQQKDKKFVPFATVVRTGDAVVFSNVDDITHHVYSVSGPERFSFSLKSGEKHQPLEFKHTGVVAMGCNIHDWMSGYLLVVSSNYVKSTDEHGRVSFADVPGGRYRLNAWHPLLREPESISQFIDTHSPVDVQLKLSRPMADYPKQKSVDDFDFLEGY